MLGGVLANVMMGAMPAAKAFQMLKVGPGVLRGALAAGTTSGVQGALTTPVAGDGAEAYLNKGVQGAKDAATGAVLQGTLGALVKPFAGMFKPSAEAKGLFEKGINPTLQQGSEGFWGKTIGGLAANPTKTLLRQRDEVSDVLHGRLTEGNSGMPRSTGSEMVDDVRHYLGDQYDKLYRGKKIVLGPKLRGELSADVSHINPQGQFRSSADKASKVWNDTMGPGVVSHKTGQNLPEVINASTFRDRYLTPLQRKIFGDEVMGDAEAIRRLTEAREKLIEKARNVRLAPDELKRLKELDNLNFDYQRLKEATRGRVGEEEGLDITKLVNAYSKKKGEATSIGNTTLDDIVGPAYRTLEKPSRAESLGKLAILRRSAPGLVAGGAAGLGTAAATGSLGAGALPLAGMYLLSGVGNTAKGSKALFGQYKMQKALAEYLRSSKYGLRPGMAVPGLAVSTPDEEYE
jgi:hypothetical protein